MWTKDQIKDHIKAAKILDQIKDLAFDYISKHKKITEHEVKDFVLEKFKEYNLRTSYGIPIVAFRANSANPHYQPAKASKIIKANTLIKLDIWAKLNKKSAPFADITWMAFCGKKVPVKMKNVFNIVIEARDEGIKYIEAKIKNKQMPRGKEVDKVVRNHIHKYGHGGNFIHGTGHSLGLISPHGNKGLIRGKSKGFLRQNVAYTIEPGIYLPGEFGVRSEIDFYVNSKFQLIITTKVQKEIVKI